jgi:hypothetical protein
MSILPAYQRWWRNGLMYLPPPPSQSEPVTAVPPEPPPLSQVPELAPAGKRAIRAIVEATAAAAIPALVRVLVKPVSFVGRRG